MGRENEGMESKGHENNGMGGEMKGLAVGGNKGKEWEMKGAEKGRHMKAREGRERIKIILNKNNNTQSYRENGMLI